MNLIDISGWQKGLNLSTLFAKNPALDGVIVKATGGVSYVNPKCDPWVQWLIANKKPWGFYHYLNDDNQGSSGAMEARYFVQNTRVYFGHGMPWVDYEGEALKMGTLYLKAFLDTVLDMTGVKCGVYCSQSVTQSQDFYEIAKAGYPLWMAQYADMQPVNGFVDSPWHSGSVAPFDGYVMQQYTSCGRLDGWSGNLDFDKYNGTAEDWRKMLGGKEESAPVPTPAPTPTPQKKKCNQLVVSEVLQGKYGNGSDRVKRLTDAGYDAEEVQKKINELYGIALTCKKYCKGNMDYINSIVYLMKLL